MKHNLEHSFCEHVGRTYLIPFFLLPLCNVTLTLPGKNGKLVRDLNLLIKIKGDTWQMFRSKIVSHILTIVGDNAGIVRTTCKGSVITINLVTEKYYSLTTQV